MVGFCWSISPFQWVLFSASGLDVVASGFVVIVVGLLLWIVVKEWVCSWFLWVCKIIIIINEKKKKKNTGNCYKTLAK
jgi:hypothetical protein